AGARRASVRRAARAASPSSRARAPRGAASGHAALGGAPAGERRYLGRVRVRRRSDRGDARGWSRTHKGGEVIGEGSVPDSGGADRILPGSVEWGTALQ